MSESTPPSEALAPPERPPFAGFFPRLGAFLIDCALFYFLFKGLDHAARPALLGLNPALPWLGHLLLFLYFWIGYGPLPKGQTLGKALLGIAVVGGDGRPIGWAAAARRALVQQGVFLIFLVNPVYQLVFPTGVSYASSIALSALSTAAIIYLATLALTVAFHPWRRGWHDLWAGAFVTSAPTPLSFRNALDTPPDVVTERKIANFVKMSLIFWAVATVLILFFALRSLLTPEQRKVGAQLEALNKTLALPEYRVLVTSYPPSMTVADAMTEIGQMRQHWRSMGQTVPTTESLMQQAESIQAGLVRRHGPIPPDALTNPALRQGMEKLRLQLWRDWQTRAPAQTTTGSLTARRFEAQLLEPFSIVMYNAISPFQPRVRVFGPANPAQGGLTFENVSPPAPQATDQATTTSAAPAPVRTQKTPGP